MTHCMRHFEEPVVAFCRTCSKPYCSRCLVFSFGPDKPPFCVGCALNASGVRNKNKPVIVNAEAPPESDRRVERAEKRAQKAEAKATVRALKRAAKRGEVPLEEQGPRTSNVPVPRGLTTTSSRFAPPPAEHAVN